MKTPLAKPQACDTGTMDATNTHGDDRDDQHKRQAMAGQWRTPPLPVFAATVPNATTNPSIAKPELPPQAEIKIPSSTEDYAKALQEAYLKGAEAAAKLAQQQQQVQVQPVQVQQQANLPGAVSCPNFSPPSPSSPVPSTTPHAVSSMPVLGTMAEEAAYVAATTTTPSQAMTPSISTASMRPPPPQQPIYDGTTHTMVSFAAPPPMPPVTQAPSTQQQPPAPQKPQAADSQAAQSRSLSLPDMSAYAAQAEEEKRQKRLARNRASARLRRLRKKNLVDAYETEVGILEKTLQKLQAHEWGRDDDHKALLDALGMERGQQAIPPEQRAEMIQTILAQQQQQVELLRQAQLEQECLAMLGSAQPDDTGLAAELQEILQLSDEQKSHLADGSVGLETEVDALETISASLQAMQENKWLLNEGVQNITDQFTSILHKNQLSKFLLWTDANVEVIDQLDHVQVQPLQTAPIFTFGVETTPMDDDEKQ